MISEKYISEQIKENNYSLLGEVTISDEEYVELIEKVKIIAKNMSPATGVRSNIYLALALVQVAIREYKEGRYWTYFCEAIGEEISSSKLNYFGKVFAATVKQYGLLYIDRDENSSQMYVENIKLHSIVTNYYMNGFWEFAYSFYEKNLFRQVSEDMAEDIEMLAVFMRNTLDNNSDSIVGEEGREKAPKSYKLLKATRSLLANNNVEANVRMLLPLFSMIDKYYYDSELPETDERFGKSFVEWSKLQEIVTSKSEEGGRVRLLASKRPYIHLDFNSMMSFLCIPSQKFRESECEGEATAVVIINGYKKEIELEVYKSFGIFISEKVRIPIPSVFDDIEVQIESSITKKYRILASNYRLFNKNYDSLTKMSKGYNLLLTEKGTKVEFDIASDCIDYTNDYDQFGFYSINVSNDSIVHIGSRTISLAGEYSEEPFFEEEIIDFDIYDYDGNKIVATRNHPTVSFVVEERKFDGTVLIVNGIKCPLTDIKNKMVYSTATSGKVAVILTLEEILPKWDGVFDVIIDIPDEKNKRVSKYVRLEKLDIRFGKSIYSADDTVYVLVTNEEKNIWPIREDIELAGINANTDEYLVPVIGDEEYIDFYLELNELLTAKIPLYVFRAGFSATSMSFEQPEYIWYSDLQETLYCKAPDLDEVRVYLNHNKDDYLVGENIGKNIFRIDISALKEQIVSNTKDVWAYINVICFGRRKRSFVLYSILRTMWVDPYFDFVNVNGTIAFNMKVEGKAELVVDIEDEYTKEKLVEDRIIKSGVTLLPELKSNGTYNIFPKMVEEDEFGLNCQVQSLRHLYNQSYVVLDDLREYRLPIGDLLYEDEKLKLSYDYFIDVREKIDSKTFEGYMHGLKKEPRKSRTQNSKYTIGADGRPIKKKFGKVRIEILEEDDKSILIQILTDTYDEIYEEWIELYYDNEQNTLLHCNDHALGKAVNYSKFTFLDADNTKYKIMKKKIRRLHIDAF